MFGRDRASRRVAVVFLDHPDEWLTGLEVRRMAGIRMWPVFRVLEVFLRHGWLEDSWRPGPKRSRRFYRATPGGLVVLRGTYRSGTD